MIRFVTTSKTVDLMKVIETIAIPMPLGSVIGRSRLISAKSENINIRTAVRRKTFTLANKDNSNAFDLFGLRIIGEYPE